MQQKRSPNLKPETKSKKIFHEQYPIDITDLTESEINQAIEDFCKKRNVAHAKKEVKSNKKKKNVKS